MGIRVHYPSPKVRGIRGGLGAAVAVALLAGSSVSLTAVAAHADTGAPPVITDPEAIASAQAQSTGKAVPVDADTTAASTTVANPDGSFTYSASPVPVRVKQNGSWVALDATLQANADGTLSPKAASSSVVFSGGGSSPLATLTDAQGRQVTVSWPSPLPTPTVSGDTATYAGVYPGVDLQMAAATDGGYTEHLVVKTAAAAANPALQDIHLNTSTSAGLALSRNAAGGLQATDASGQAVFSSPTATMWSSGSQSSGTSSPSTMQTQSLSAQNSSPSTNAVAKDDASPVADLSVNVSGSGVDLVPPPGALTASTNTYPLVIDPSLSPAENGWTWIASNTPSTSYWQGSNNTHDSNAHVGYDDWCSDGTSGCSAFGVTRSMFSFSMGALTGKHVTGATLTLDEQGPTSSTSGSRSYDLYGGGGITSSTTWNNQSVWPNVSASASFASINSNTLGSANFTVTALVQNALTQGYGAQTMIVEAHSESDDSAYRYLIGSATATGHPDLVVNYWSTPPLPAGLSITNGGKTLPCTTTGGIDTASPGYWVNASDSKTIKLNATLSSPDSGSDGTDETSQFWLHETAPTPPPSWTNLGGTTVSVQSTPQAVSATTPVLNDGAIYQWQVYATNPGGYSSTASPGASTDCWFQTDFTSPSVGTPTGTPPTSTASGSNQAALTFTATDSGSGVDHFLFNMNGTSLTSGGDGMNNIAATNGSAPFTVSADHWGTNTVWYAAVDKAGNQSQPQHYDFYAADGAYSPGTAGDLGNDHIPDLAAVNTGGDLTVYKDPMVNDPGTSGATLIPASSAPNGTGFGGALIAHAGSFTGQSCDDPIVIQPQAGTISIEENNNCASTPSGQFTQVPLGTMRPATVNGDATNYNSTDWSSVQQAVALPKTAATNNKPALITLENDNGVWTVWMFTPAQGATRFTTATLLATGSAWSNVTLISPGLVGGNPALWTRDKTSGALTQYANVEADTTSTLTGTVLASSGYSAATYPMITSDGPLGNVASGATNGPALWAVTPAGALTLITTTVDTNGNVTALQAPATMTAAGWGNSLTSIN